MPAIPRNIAGWDRALHVGVGTALLAITFWGPQTYVGWIGVGPLLAGLAGYEPLYDLVGFTTRRLPSSRSTSLAVRRHRAESGR